MGAFFCDKKDFLPAGIYDALLDECLKDALNRYPDVRSVLSKIETEEQPARYAAFVAKVIEQALRQEVDPDARLALCNRLIDIISDTANRNHLKKRRLVRSHKSVLLEITPPHFAQQGVPRPHTSLIESSLFTGSPQDPQLVHELCEEMTFR